jgi:hypothetical protein
MYQAARRNPTRLEISYYVVGPTVEKGTVYGVLQRKKRKEREKEKKKETKKKKKKRRWRHASVPLFCYCGLCLYFCRHGQVLDRCL